MNQETTRQVWDGMLDAERLSRYYGYLAQKLEKIDRRLAISAAIASSASFVSLATNWLPEYPWLPSVLTAVTSVLTIWLVSSQNSRKAVKSAIIRRRCSDLLLEWEVLWSESTSMQELDVRARWEELRAKETAITDGLDVELPEDKALEKLSEIEAYQYRQQVHAT
jgi:hypothetical protein